jgi:hypothetical protein
MTCYRTFSPVGPMYREGDYPPLRGTMIGLDREAILFTRGSVPIYRTYPGFPQFWILLLNSSNLTGCEF